MLTGHNDAAAAVEAVATGADDLLAKPVAVDLLAARIERTIDRAQRIAELKRSNAMLDARIATRAIELGEARTELAERREECRWLTQSVAALNARLSVSRSEEQTSELQSLMRTSYAVFCLKKKKTNTQSN